MSSPLRRRVSRTLLDQMLDDPEILPQLRALPVPVLRQAILEIGLEDAGELIALSSLEQLRGLFDEDLWQSPRPGRDEAFDGPRFAVWLEVLLEAGEAFAADRLAELSEDFLAFSFSQVVLVLDAAEVAASIADADEAGLLDKALDARLCQELDEFLVVSRLENGWDAAWTTLLALDERHTELLRSVLHRCWLATREQAEDAGGLYTVLSEEELLLEDARAEREDRRAESGYVSPADARAFLELARRPSDSPAVDPITRAYFRELGPAPAAPGPTGGDSETPSRAPRAAPLRRLLARAGVEPPSEPTLTAAGSLFREGVADLLDSDPEAHARIVQELAYLANVLVAGDEARAWRAVEAAEHVMSLCDEGLRSVLGRSARPAPATAREALLDRGAVGLFRVAWAGRRPPG